MNFSRARARWLCVISASILCGATLTGCLQGKKAVFLQPETTVINDAPLRARAWAPREDGTYQLVDVEYPAGALVKVPAKAVRVPKGE